MTEKTENKEEVSSSNNKKKEEEPRPAFVVRLYQDRFKQLRKGQEYSQKGDIPKLVECYSKYLNILAQFFNVKETQLTPELFDSKKDLSELLLISNVYWSLAKTYDRNSNLHDDSRQCLEQFAKFSSGFKYQYANARMIKNYIKRGKALNSKNFKTAYEKIRMDSPTCFVSTYCFGTNHPVTIQLRPLKRILIKNYGGFLVDGYYRFSPLLVDFLESNYRIKKILLPVVKGTLFSLAKALSYLR